MLPNTAIIWLETLLHEWISSDLHIESDSTQRRVICAGKTILAMPVDVAWEEDKVPACTAWNACREGFSPLFSEPMPILKKLSCKKLWQSSDVHPFFDFDILGFVWWVLSRKEETTLTAQKKFDKHGRFPAHASHAMQNGYLDRPIVDEWMNIFVQCIQRILPDFQPNKHEYTICPTHDIDSISRYGFCSWGQLFRHIGGDIIHYKQYTRAFFAPLSRYQFLCGKKNNAPYDCYDMLMDYSEQMGTHSAFYFKAGASHPSFDTVYPLSHPRSRALLRHIHERGHEIGIHPSYEASCKPEIFSIEAEKLRKICEEENITQPQWGGRMHYLRWQSPKTAYLWADNGFKYDSSLGYADCAGFRCGTCREYQAFDPIAMRTINVRIRPLIVMDGTVVGKDYMNLKQPDEVFLSLAERCHVVQGNFVYLWHNGFMGYDESLRNIIVGLKNNKV